MKKTKKHILIPIVIVALTAIVSMGATLAQTSPTQQTQAPSALQVEYSGLPGTSINGQISILNTSKETRTITLSIEECQAESKVESLTDWLVLPSEGFTVEPGEKVVIPYTINVPANAPAQGYYGAIQVHTANKEGLETGQLILLEVEGSNNKEFILQDLSLNEDSLDVVIGNSGDVHGSVEGLIEIMDLKGNMVNEIPLNGNGENILPNNAVTYVEDSYTKNLPAGVYYLVVDGKADNGQQVQGKITFKTDRTGKIEIIEKYIGAVDVDSLRGVAQGKYVVFQTVLAVIAIFIFTVAFVAIGRYCIVSAKPFGRK